MKDDAVQKSKWEALLTELEGIRDVYRLDVKQFIGFVREKKLLIVDGFRKYAAWLEEEHDGKRYSPATINRKLAAARSRVRYAFKRSAFAADLQEVPAGGNSQIREAQEDRFARRPAGQGS